MSEAWENQAVRVGGGETVKKQMEFEGEGFENLRGSKNWNLRKSRSGKVKEVGRKRKRSVRN
jgi:hypothetical protein